MAKRKGNRARTKGKRKLSPAQRAALAKGRAALEAKRKGKKSSSAKSSGGSKKQKEAKKSTGKRASAKKPASKRKPRRRQVRALPPGRSGSVPRERAIVLASSTQMTTTPPRKRKRQSTKRATTKRRASSGGYSKRKSTKGRLSQKKVRAQKKYFTRRYLDLRTGKPVNKRMVKRHRKNPSDGWMGVAIKTGGLITGTVSAVLLDRWLATRGGEGSKHAWYGRDAAARIYQRADAVRLGAQAAGGFVMLGLAALAGKKYEKIGDFLVGNAFGMWAHAGAQVLVERVLPKVAPVKDGNEMNYGNRIAPEFQDVPQDALDALVKATNDAGGDYVGQIDGEVLDETYRYQDPSGHGNPLDMLWDTGTGTAGLPVSAKKADDTVKGLSNEDRMRRLLDQRRRNAQLAANPAQDGASPELRSQRQAAIEAYRKAGTLGCGGGCGGNCGGTCTCDGCGEKKAACKCKDRPDYTSPAVERPTVVMTDAAPPTNGQRVATPDGRNVPNGTTPALRPQIDDRGRVYTPPVTPAQQAVATDRGSVYMPPVTPAQQAVATDRGSVYGGRVASPYGRNLLPPSRPSGLSAWGNTEDLRERATY